MGSPFPSPGNLPDPGIKPRLPALHADSLSSESPGKELKETMSKNLKKSLRIVFCQRDKESLRTVFHQDNIKR